MRRTLGLLFFLSACPLMAAPPMTTVYSYGQSASFSSANFGISRTVNGGTPDNSYTWRRSIDFTKVPPTHHEVLTYSTSHPYSAGWRGIRVRRWDDKKVPFEVRNDRYIRRSLALGYFYKPGQRAYIDPSTAR